MTEIDKPFRITRRFALVWACLAFAVGLLVFRRYAGSLYEKSVVTLLGSFYATFCLYGPILLMRQVTRSGGRGWQVLRALVTVVLGSGLVLLIIALTNHGEVPIEAIAIVGFIVSFHLSNWLGRA